MAGSAALSPKLREEYEGKLLVALNDEEMIAEKKKQISDALAGELKLIKSEIKRIRRVLNRQESPQTEIPGTEVGERKRSPIVEGLLRAADGLEAVKKLRRKIQKAAQEGDEKRATLKWRQEKEGVEIAEVKDGKYQITFDSDHFNVQWIPADGKGLLIGLFRYRPEAQRAAEQYLLENQGDAILKNAGAGKLTDKSLKGEPVARRKGRGRRG